MLNLQQKYKIVEDFEQAISVYTGAPYVACVDCCTNALILCLTYSKKKIIGIPKNTYVGVGMACLQTKKKIKFDNREWRGVYQLKNTNIYDAAKRFTSNMYIPLSNMCVSFHYKKHLKIGRGGAILTDNKNFYDWLILARNNGKNISDSLDKQTFNILGYNMLLHPDLARKGLSLLKKLPRHNDDLPFEYYGDLSKQMKQLLD